MPASADKAARIWSLADGKQLAVLKGHERVVLQAVFSPAGAGVRPHPGTLESGTAPTESVARRLVELDRLTGALTEVIRAESLGRWLRAANPAFDGLKPAEVIERGEADRLWEMAYFLRSGVAS